MSANAIVPLTADYGISSSGSLATLTGLPATTAPGRPDSRRPAGRHPDHGPYLEDATPIDVAGKLADVVGGFRSPPGYSLTAGSLRG